MTMVQCTKEFGGLKPTDDDGYRIFEKIKNGQCVMADIKDMARRSNRQHGFWFAIVTLMFMAQSHYATLDHYRFALLIKIGRCKAYPQKEGPDIVIADSVSFAKMSNDEFSSLVADTLNLAEVIGFNRDDIEHEARIKSQYTEQWKQSSESNPTDPISGKPIMDDEHICDVCGEVMPRKVNWGVDCGLNNCPTLVARRNQSVLITHKFVPSEGDPTHFGKCGYAEHETLKHSCEKATRW